MKKAISQQKQQEILDLLKKRFERNMARHKGIVWDEVKAKLEAQPSKLWTLNEMEATGGEPDVVGYNKAKDEFVFFDCSTESPKGRRSLCYDREAWEQRKEHKPKSNAIDAAAEIGINLLTEEQYRHLQQIGDFDTKTSSWVLTPAEIRKHGGAIFCDKRYKHVFMYHNGAESYYAARGFRGVLYV